MRVFDYFDRGGASIHHTSMQLWIWFYFHRRQTATIERCAELLQS